jgi:GATA-binding protein
MRAAPHDSMVRRNTFPYVRHDQDASAHPHFAAPGAYVDHHSQHPAGPMLAPYGAGRPDVVYGEPMPLGGSPHLPLAAEPSALHEPYGHPHAHHGHPGGMYSLEGEAVKLEDGPSVIVPSQAGFYRPPSSGGMPMSAAYLSPHTGLPIQHTDDAASKETQYLRRRCFNCHTTEPPSWRRSTLNPGKIVCNKCGLYERTHLRPRPLRFDELRAGNKARKATKTPGANGASPKTSRATVKKEPREHLVGGSDAISRRASVSSNASTTSSVGATSDWDDNASFGSSGSGFNSPAQSTFSIPRDSASASPPMHPNMVDGGIRLPNAPLSDIATLDGPQRKGSSPAYFAAPPMYGSPRLAPAGVNEPFRRNTVTLPLGADIPDATGWQSVSADFTPQGVQGSPKTTPRANSVTVA